MEAVTHEQGGLEAGTRAVVGVGVPWDAHSPFPKTNLPGKVACAGQSRKLLEENKEEKLHDIFHCNFLEISGKFFFFTPPLWDPWLTLKIKLTKTE